MHQDLYSLIKSENGCEYSDIDNGKILQVGDKYSVQLHVLHLNIRSLIRNKQSLVMLLNDLQEKGVLVHVIGLCETFLTCESSRYLHIENYEALHKCCRNKTGGGVTLLIHDSVRLVKELSTPFTDTLESVSAVLWLHGKEFSVCEFYRPPNSKDSEFFVNLHAALECLNNFKLDINFMCCDQNYDLLKSSQHKSTCDCLSLMLDNGYVPYIVKPTRITHRSGTLIDNIYMKMKLL